MRVVQEGGEELEELQLAQSHLGVNCRGRRECVNIRISPPIGHASHGA